MQVKYVKGVVMPNNLCDAIGDKEVLLEAQVQKWSNKPTS